MGSTYLELLKSKTSVTVSGRSHLLYLACNRQIVSIDKLRGSSSDHALSLFVMLSLHQSSGIGFERRTFPFLGFRTYPVPQPQQLKLYVQFDHVS
jgi:hypothetical protein